MSAHASLRTVFSFIWTSAALALFAWLFYANFPADGRLTVRAAAAEPSGFIGGFQPTTRADVRPGEGGAWQTVVTGDPAYFTMAKPSFYRTAQVRLRFRNDGQPVVELGGRASLDAWTFDLEPLDAPFLDRLTDEGWSARQDGPLRAYEKKVSGFSAEDLLSERAAGARVATYHADPIRWGMKLPAERGGPYAAPTSRTGRFVAYVYAASEGLDLSLEFADRNREEGLDRAEVRVRGKDSVLFARTLEDDGVADATARTEPSRAVPIVVTNAKPGLYRIEADLSPDLELIAVRSAHRRLVFAGETGFETLWPGAAFEPEFPQLNVASDPDAFDVIVARYRPPEVDPEGWKIAEAKFDLGALAASAGRVQMALSLPAIRDVGGAVTVRDVEITYARPPWTFVAFRDAVLGRVRALLP